MRLCRELPEGEDRERLELEILGKLESAQFSILGYASQAAGDTNARALQLAKKLGATTQILNALGGGWLFNMVRGRLAEARDKSSQFLAIVGEGHVLSPTGHFMLGAALFHLGDAASAHRHLEKAQAADREGGDALLPVFFGPNIGMFSRSYMSHILWYEGSVEQAFRSSDEAVARARALAHPFSLAIASTYAAMACLLAADLQAAEERAGEAAALSRQYDFSYYRAFAGVLQAAAHAQQGSDAAALQEFRQALDGFRATGSEIRLPYFHALFGEACLSRGLTTEGLASVAAGLDCESRNGETWCAALLRCVRGDLLRAANRHEESRESYRAALEMAISQGAKPYEARARQS